MKSKFLNIASAVVLLLAVGLVGCTREETNDENTTRTMLLKVTQATTRAVGAPVTSATTVELKAPGYVFFVTSSGVIAKKLELKANGAANEYSESTPDQVTSAQLTTGSGIQIENVPASASRVYVFGTVPSSFSSIAPGAIISEYVEAALAVGDVYKSDGSVDNVPLLGSGPIVATVTPNEYAATVQVAPTVGRVELAKVSALTDEITSFTVTGVYVNYYYDVLGVNGKDLGEEITAFVNNGSVDTKYAGTSEYAGQPALYDEPDANSIEGIVTFDASKSLAYNLLAPNFVPSFVDESDKYFPHLVLRIDNVVPKDPTLTAVYAGTWFITVTSVAVSDDLTTPLAFEAGKVYNIGDLVFGLGDLTEVPEPDVKTVRVKVTVKNWELVDVIPGLN